MEVRHGLFWLEERGSLLLVFEGNVEKRYQRDQSSRCDEKSCDGLANLFLFVACDAKRLNERLLMRRGF